MQRGEKQLNALTADGAHAVLHAPGSLAGDSHLVEECSGHSNHNNKAFLQLTACYFFLFFFLLLFGLKPICLRTPRKTGRSGGRAAAGTGQDEGKQPQRLMTNHQ